MAEGLALELATLTLSAVLTMIGWEFSRVDSLVTRAKLSSLGLETDRGIRRVMYLVMRKEKPLDY